MPARSPLTCELGTVIVTGDYKFDQTPVDGPPTDAARLAEFGREGVLLLCGDSTNADREGTTPSEASRRAGAPRGLLARRGPDRDHVVRVQPAPGATGDRHGDAARPAGRGRRALDAKEPEHRAPARARTCARGTPRLAEGDRVVPGRQARSADHRKPGRAALGASPDGPPGAPAGEAPLGRHHHLLGHADSRERAGGQRDGRPPLPDRRDRHHDPGCRRSRVRTRPRGGDQADAEPDSPALRDAGARRSQAALPALQAGRIGRRRPG